MLFVLVMNQPLIRFLSRLEKEKKKDNMKVLAKKHILRFRIENREYQSFCRAWMLII